LVIWGNELRFNVDEMKKKIINFVDSRNSIGKVA